MDNIFDAYGDFADDDMSYEIFLDAAYEADDTNRTRVAVHLFMAAYELAKENGRIPSEEVVDGLRRAWTLSLESSDRVSAETIFGALAPFSTREQTKQRARERQKLTVKELESMGIPTERIEGMHRIYNPDAMVAGADPDFSAKFNKMMSSEPKKHDSDTPNPPESNRPPKAPKPPKANHPVIDLSAIPIPPSQTPPENPRKLPMRLDYSQLIGFDSAIKQMRVYGFDTAGDATYSEFAQRAAEFHGMNGVAFSEPLIFCGPSREDTYDFAEATAGELGFPLMVLHTRTDEEGIWTVKLSGPFRRGMFGMSDPLDVPVPCVFLLENIDILQDLVRASINGEYDDHAEFAGQGPHMAYELISYISTLVHKPGVHTMATADSDLVISAQFDSLFENAPRIRIDHPNADERMAIWQEFASSHRSFETVDLAALTEFSGGISRHEMLAAALEAVRKAYQISLETQEARYVELSDVLFEMVPLAMRDGDASDLMEPAAAPASIHGLDGFSFLDESEDSQE